MNDEELFKKRLMELAEASYNKNHYTYTGFLSSMELSIYLSMQKELSFVDSAAFGGADGCERQMVRFGSEELFGYAEAFPIECIKAEPLAVKFAEELTHRDFLGALMNLGIERSTIGDILVRDKVGYIFATTAMADYIVNELTKVRHTHIKSCITTDIPDDFAGRKVEQMIMAESERLDGVIAKIYKLSRSQSIDLFRSHRVFIDGGLCENNSLAAKAGNVISVRGHGKFEYGGVISTSKKGKKNILVHKYEG